MSYRTPALLQTTRNEVMLLTVRGSVTGTGGVAAIPDLTGTFHVATDMSVAINYGSGSLSLPSGSMQVVLPSDNRYARLLDWNINWEGSGSTLTSFAGTTGDETLGIPQNFRAVKYGHDMASGTLSFGFVQQLMTGSAGINVGTGHWIGSVPADNAHSNAMAGTWTLSAWLLNTGNPV